MKNANFEVKARNHRRSRAGAWIGPLALILVLISPGLTAAQPEPPQAPFQKFDFSENPNRSCLFGAQTLFPDRCSSFPYGNANIPHLMPQSDVEFCRQECDECCAGVISETTEYFLGKLEEVCNCSTELLSGNLDDFLSCSRDVVVNPDDLQRFLEENLPTFLPGFGPRIPGIDGPAGRDPFRRQLDGGILGTFLPQIGPPEMSNPQASRAGALWRIANWILAELATTTCSDIRAWSTDQIQSNCDNGCKVYHGGVPESPEGPGQNPGGSPEGGGGGGGNGGGGGGEGGCPFVGGSCTAGPFEGFVGSDCTCIVDCSQYEGNSCFAGGVEGSYRSCDCVAVEVREDCDLCTDPWDPYDPEGRNEYYCDTYCSGPRL